MKSHFYHTQINVDYAKHGQFYKELMTLLGWSEIFSETNMAGYKSGTTGDIWFVDAEHKEINHYDNIGVSHIAIRVEKQSDVDEVVSFLTSKNIPGLFETPRHRPEFSMSEKETYYQVIFESPDKIQIEVVYVGVK
jgi:catechol-2,3-dioxygenase